MKPKIIAIDGPAASGKTTLASLLAERHQYLFLDTGIMYRAATWYALHKELDLHDEAAVITLTRQMPLEILSPTVSMIDDGRQTRVMIEQYDITWLIRSPEVDANVSRISAYAEVRQILVEKQRKIAQKGPVIMVGRDIGTVVLPQADLKIYVDASAEVRAKRRFDECQQQGQEADYKSILSGLIERDKVDREREVSPMLPASDAIIINTDTLDKETVVEQIETLIMGM